MSKKVATVSPGTTLVTVGRMMSEKKISCVIVQDNNEVLGIISERDIVRRLADNGDTLSKIKAKQAMSSPVHTLYADTTLERAMALMTEKGFRRFPILNRKDKLVGIVTQSDVLRSFVGEMEVAHEKMKDLAIRDYLTGMYNRRLFMTALEKEFYRSKRYKTPMAIIMIDIDDFKDINDKYGHQYGDRILQIVGEIIRRQSRDADVAARYGGEEFIVLTHGSEVEHASRFAERLRAAISESEVTVSCGVAHYPNEKSRFPDDLIRLSDEALYEAKKRGKNQVVCWSENMMEKKDVT
jgi:diguanylate cyclase (GGDEF)-like protein